MISVIIPFYNAREYLPRCAKSLTQEGDFEFLFIDDHSTDHGAEILSEIKDNRFKVLKNEHKKGVSGARNTGLDYATGDWITFLDVDDEFVPDVYTVFERMTRLNETANIIQANHLRHYEKKGLTVLKYPNEGGVYRLCELPFSNWPKCWCMVWNKLIRRSFIEENKIRFKEGLQYGEDEIFNLTCCKYDRRLYHTKYKTVTVMRHFDNKQSLCRVKAKDWRGLVKQSQELERFLLKTENPLLRRSVYEIIAEHWNSGRYQSAFGVE